MKPGLFCPLRLIFVIKSVGGRGEGAQSRYFSEICAHCQGGFTTLANVLM